MPPGYPGRPEIAQGNLFFWTAFWELCSDRQVGMGGEGRIPSLALRAYAAEYGIIEYPDLRWFIRVIRAMDSEYLELRKPKGKDAPTREVRFDDHAGIRGLLRRAAALRDRGDDDRPPPETKDDLPPEPPEDGIEDAEFEEVEPEQEQDEE